MLPITQMSSNVAQGIRAVFSDIDDTMTTGGKVTARAYEAMWRLKEAGIAFVPVTGRPAGWCDCIARQWPVSGVIGENGALAFYEESGALKRMYHPDSAKDAQERLGPIREAVLKEVKGSRVSKDQFGRLFDLAIDFCEEPPDLGLDAARKIQTIFERFGAVAKISSIHVNGWFGEYDKLQMVRHFAEARWNQSIDEAPGAYLFCGDSPNDEPMFAFFENACGVANLNDFTSQMQHLPKFISSASGGEGFAQIIETFLDLRQRG